MKHKRIAKVTFVVALAFCALILLMNLSSELQDMDFAVTPKSWKFYVRERQEGTVYNTNGIAESFTNRVSHIGPVIITEFNR